MDYLGERYLVECVVKDKQDRIVGYDILRVTDGNCLTNYGTVQRGLSGQQVAALGIPLWNASVDKNGSIRVKQVKGNSFSKPFTRKECATQDLYNADLNTVIKKAVLAIENKIGSSIADLQRAESGDEVIIRAVRRKLEAAGIQCIGLWEPSYKDYEFRALVVPNVKGQLFITSLNDYVQIEELRFINEGIKLESFRAYMDDSWHVEDRNTRFQNRMNRR